MADYSNYTSSILQICRLEEENKIFEEEILTIPIWSTVISRMRGIFTEKHANVPPLSNHSKLNFSKFISTTLKSLYQISRLYFSRKNIDNFIYGFPRLELINGEYVDKFCDELIKQTSISESYCYMARSRSFIHPKPRNLPNILWLEFIDNIGEIIGKIGFPLWYLVYKKKYDLVFSKANKILPLTKKDKIFIVSTSIREVIRYLITTKLLKKLKAKRIFAPILRHKPFLLAVAKRLDIPCFELQHGMTEGPTILYSGSYLSEFSPTAFLAFGKSSMIPVFNVPMNKMVNIGFPYKKFLTTQVKEFKKNHYLLVSDPEVTQKIVDVACDLKTHFPECEFHIRFHPQEKANEQQFRKLYEYGIKINDNKKNSSLAVLEFEGIIGEMSSVLYESLNLNRKTAKLHFNGLNPEMDEQAEQNKGFFVINRLEDFNQFKTFILTQENIIEFYSDFNIKEFNNILKIQHFKMI